MNFDYKNNKKIKIIFLIILIIGVLCFGAVAFIFGKNFNVIFGKTKNTNIVSENNKQQYSVIRKEVVDEESSVVDSVAKVSDSVVSIVISKNVSKYKTININPFNDSDLFGFGGLTQQVPTGEIQKQEVGGGSGFIISEDGIIVTNRHVVDDESAMYSVVLNNEKTYDLDVLARDTVNDVAICKIKNLKDKLKPLQLGDSDQLKLGQTVIAIGNALAEYRNTVTKGIVSGVGRNISAGSYYSGTSEVLENVIQTDAAINSGNSGGPLINLSGEVIGINTAVSSQGQNIGFAIPVNSVKYVIDSVLKTGRIVRPYIGIRYVQLTESIAKANNLPYNYGVIVLRGQNTNDDAVIKDSPAYKAGIKENDIILEINNTKLDQDYSLIKQISNMKVGDKIKLKVYRNSKILDIDLVLEEKTSK
ncbi:MAG: trypsin-like peptidase domain-containing protein [Patescibacteria group bacterium]